MNLIPQLKQEHVEIIRTFNSIKTGVSNGKSGVEELLNDLKELKNTLVAHLGLEDKLLYPALAKSKVTEAKELGEKFSDEMAEISKVALAFFGKYMSETISDLLQSSEFRKELNGIIQAVTKRIDAEEDILFPAYNKCCANK